ncbi:hypothetical protein MKW92_053589, partial [Papaver armeniacum]
VLLNIPWKTQHQFVGNVKLGLQCGITLIWKRRLRNMQGVVIVIEDLLLIL